MAESWLRTILTHEGYNGVATTIMDALSASSVAALHAAFKIKPSNLVHEKYLHPLRDVDPTMRLFQPWQCDKCQILMVGPDTSQLRERILNPEAYYKRYQGQRLPQLEAWVVGIPPTSNSQKRAKRLARQKRLYQNRENDMSIRVGALVKLTDILDKDTLRQCPYDTKEPDLNTMVGDSILVKTFGLFPSGGCLDPVTVGMKFAGMTFCLPWNVNRSQSSESHWRPTDGLPYINAAAPFCPQEGLVSHRDVKDIDALVFHCQQPGWNPSSAVFIRTNASRA